MKQWKWLRCLSVAALSAVVLMPGVLTGAQSYNELETIISGPFHHTPDPVSKEQFERDQARCRVVAIQTQVNADSSVVAGYARMAAQLNCMRALGYLPGPAAKTNTRRKAGLGLDDLKAAGGGVGVTRCSEFNEARGKTAETEAMFFSWTEGFLTGWNMGLPDTSQEHAELSSIPRDDQMAFLRKWCKENPTKRYMEGATMLFVRLRPSPK
jgi:hypothetical protein